MNVLVCASCGTEAPHRFSTCPSCGALLRPELLQQLIRESSADEASGDLASAIEKRRQAASLLPRADPRREELGADIERLMQQLATAPAPHPTDRARASLIGKLGLGGALLALLWKLKFALAFVLSKGKLLLLGLSKSGTLLSMFASIGVYWALWGWKFGLGLVLLIYVHEMGHVAALAQLGVPTAAPMFVPGLGAFVGHAPLATDRQQAIVSLAGPSWGLGATLVSLGLFHATGLAVFAALAQWSARINLFNLIPLPPLDGSGAFHSLNRPMRFSVAALAAGCLWSSHEGMLWLVLLVSGARALRPGSPLKGDPGVCGRFLGLLVALSWLASRPVVLAE